MNNEYRNKRLKLIGSKQTPTVLRSINQLFSIAAMANTIKEYSRYVF